MISVNKIEQIRSNLKRERILQKKIAFVPTMGALHEGHIALVKKAKELADIVVVSIFVNKAQFNDSKDYEKYPRDVESDIKKLEEVAVDYVFLPQDEEIFPQDFSLKIIPTDLTNCLCGKDRPGHFEGVALVVSKLFNIIDPDIAIFGQKDFQQLLVIKKLVKDLNFDIEIVGCDIFRENSGLAMSSRNQRLVEGNKIKASNIFKILTKLKLEIESGVNLELLLQNKKKELLDLGFEKVDYLEIRREKDLKLVTKFNQKDRARIFIAVYLAGIRLIDNLALN